MDRLIEKFRYKNGIEIGGFSHIFSKDGEIPIYPVVNTLDCCNFGKQTIWEGALEEGKNFNYGDKIGYRYICEATELSKKVLLSNYDFVISSNCFEHIANPLKAFNEFLDITNEGGTILLVLPKKETNFDHKRQVTSFDHLEEDFEMDVGEGDLSHFEEIMELHDLSMDLPAGTIEQFKGRSLKNYENRALHHHVFDMQRLYDIYDYFHLKIIASAEMKTDYLIAGSLK
jgi:SAM-dependent methyltransferase